MGNGTSVAAKPRAGKQRILSKSNRRSRTKNRPDAVERRLKAQALQLTKEADAAARNVDAKVVNEVKLAGSRIPAELKKVL